jgi:hypothetical protein
LQDSSCVTVARLYDAIVHPLTFPASAHNSCSPQVSEMTADLGLVSLQDLHKETDAHFVAAYQVQQPQPSLIGQRAKEQFLIEGFRFPAHHAA